MGSLLFRLLLLTLAVIVASAPPKKGHRRHNAVDWSNQFPESSKDPFEHDKWYHSRPEPSAEWVKKAIDEMIERDRKRKDYHSRGLDRLRKVKRNHAKG
ncbi:hypothetical protein ANCCAN_04113 [Ancylostoma caninum]|uniref:Uncharacterized protein n=1 Tax=Ancylostoma caninum TaxID=29170 RepID=A0A368H3N6_ANCCA|nr:hypothetical protein ANCCAN_04113 [Ancylostoma caninum]